MVLEGCWSGIGRGCSRAIVGVEGGCREPYSGAGGCRGSGKAGPSVAEPAAAAAEHRQPDYIEAPGEAARIASGSLGASEGARARSSAPP